MTSDDHFISPRFRASKASPGTFNDWVEIYEDRTWGWVLQHADELRKQGKDSKLAALHLAVGFIEPYEVYRTGKSSEGNSKKFFRSAFSRIFSHSGPAPDPKHFDIVTEAIYEQVRCGLFHAGMTGTSVYVSNVPNAFEVGLETATGKVKHIVVNPDLFVDAVISEFRQFLSVLRDPSDAHHTEFRRHFEAAWHLVHKR